MIDRQKYNLEDGKEMSTKEMVSILFRHKNLIILTMGISLLISFYYTFSITPSYTSSSSIIIRDLDNTSSFFDIIGPTAFC